MSPISWRARVASGQSRYYTPHGSQIRRPCLWEWYVGARRGDRYLRGVFAGYWGINGRVRVFIAPPPRQLPDAGRAEHVLNIRSGSEILAATIVRNNPVATRRSRPGLATACHLGYVGKLRRPQEYVAVTPFGGPCIF
jgi:hypothetical protein